MIHRIRTWENLHFINPIPNQLQRFYVLKNSLFVDQEYSASRALCISNILSREELYLVNCDSPNERKKDSGNFHVYFYACIHTHTHKRPCKKKKKKKQKRPIVFHVFPKRATLSFVYRGAFHFHALVIPDDATRRIVSSTQLPIYGERSRATIPDNHRGHSSRDEHEVKPGERED